MKTRSFSILLNFILSFAIIIGVILYLKKNNINDTNLKEFQKSYTSKSNLKFINLPKNEQNKYIKKELLSDSVFEKTIKKLKSNIHIVQNDNMQLSNDKEDLKKIIQNLKKQFEKQRNRILQQNIEQINETELQHYKNISELRAKINDLQRENIKLLEKNDIEIIALKARINILNDKLLKFKK